MTEPSTLNYGKRTLAICGITAVVEAVLLLTMADPMLLFFVIGPPAFLAVIAWRRRTHLARSRRLAGVAIGVGAFGIAAFGIASLQFHLNQQPDRAASLAPLLVPLVQWLAILAMWIAIVRQESREKREKLPASP